MSALKSQWEQFLPNIAVSGNFFRTVEFQHPAAEAMQMWLEAIEHPLTNLWQVTEVCRRPNTTGIGATDKIEDGKTAPGNRALPLVAALEKLGEFEVAQAAMGFELVGRTAAELGIEHVARFAKNEGCLLVKGTVHPVVNGRIVTDAILPDGAREEARTVRTAHNPVQAAGRLDLSHLFRSHAQVQDFSRLLDRQCDVTKWKNFVQSMDKVVTSLNTIQAKDFETASNTKMLVLVEDSVVGKKAFLNTIRISRDALAKFAFLNEAQRTMCHGLFKEALLAYEIAYAKKLYDDFRGADEEDNADKKSALKEQTEKTGKTCREFGGSEADVQRIHAEIINGEREASFIEREDLIQELGSIAIQSRNQPYFLPDALFKPLITLRAITKIIERAAEEEKDRIVRMPAETAKPKGMR